MNGDPLDELDEQGAEIARLRLATEERLAEAPQFAWRHRDGRTEMLGAAEWVKRGDSEIERLRGVIDVYASVVQAASEELKVLRERIPITKIVHVKGQPED